MADRSALESFPDRYFGAWNGDEVTAFDAILASAFTWTDPSLPAPLTDLDGAHGFFTQSKASFADIHFDQIGEALIDEAGGRVAAQWRMTGTHTGEGLPPGVPATNKSIDVLGTDVFTLDDSGRITKLDAYYNAATLAEQLGLLG